MFKPTPVPELSIVVPCHNEAKGIERWVREWTSVLDTSLSSFEIIVINDGSTDGSGRILDKLRREISGLRLIHQLRVGHGRSLRRGYELSRGKFILQVDSSGRYEPLDFLRMWDIRLAHTLVLGYRTHRLDSLVKQTYSRSLSLMFRTLWKVAIRDPDIPFRLFSASDILPVLRTLPATFESTNLAVTAISIIHDPKDVQEIPIPYRPRPSSATSKSVSNRATFGARQMFDLFWLWSNLKVPSGLPVFQN